MVGWLYANAMCPTLFLTHHHHHKKNPIWIAFLAAPAARVKFPKRGGGLVPGIRYRYSDLLVRVHIDEI